ncbi:MAG: hypothetical protein ACKVPX_13245 [Myxococcaceae bacterium]
MEKYILENLDILAKGAGHNAYRTACRRLGKMIFRQHPDLGVFRHMQANPRMPKHLIRISTQGTGPFGRKTLNTLTTQARVDRHLISNIHAAIREEFKLFGETFPQVGVGNEFAAEDRSSALVLNIGVPREALADWVGALHGSLNARLHMVYARFLLESAEFFSGQPDAKSQARAERIRAQLELLLKSQEAFVFVGMSELQPEASPQHVVGAHALALAKSAVNRIPQDRRHAGPTPLSMRTRTDADRRQAELSEHQLNDAITAGAELFHSLRGKRVQFEGKMVEVVHEEPGTGYLLHNEALLLAHRAEKLRPERPQDEAILDQFQRTFQFTRIVDFPYPGTFAQLDALPAQWDELLALARALYGGQSVSRDRVEKALTLTLDNRQACRSGLPSAFAFRARSWKFRDRAYLHFDVKGLNVLVQNGAARELQNLATMRQPGGPGTPVRDLGETEIVRGTFRVGDPIWEMLQDYKRKASQAVSDAYRAVAGTLNPNDPADGQLLTELQDALAGVPEGELRFEDVEGKGDEMSIQLPIGLVTSERHMATLLRKLEELKKALRLRVSLSRGHAENVTFGHVEPAQSEAVSVADSNDQQVKEIEKRIDLLGDRAGPLKNGLTYDVTGRRYLGFDLSTGQVLKFTHEQLDAHLTSLGSPPLE